jgi:hypothetical protein
MVHLGFRWKENKILIPVDLPHLLSEQGKREDVEMLRMPATLGGKEIDKL